MQARVVALLSVAFVVVSFLGAPDAGAAATFGPKQYVRVAGAPQSFTDSFAQCGGGACPPVFSLAELRCIRPW